MDLKTAALVVPRLKLHDQVFSSKIPHEAKVTNQKSSGRCWLFAALNVLRLPFMEKHKLASFEFSQAYLFFWDKLEKANFFLESIVSTASEPEDSRLVAHLLDKPVNDGGQYDMFINLVNKYGLVPKKAYPETEASGGSASLNWAITNRLRKFALVLRGMVKEGKSAEAIATARQEMLGAIYRILVITLGEPPKTFDWSYREKKTEVHHKIRGLTPQKFYAEYVPTKVEEYVSLVHDPRNPDKPLMTVDHLNNMVGGRPVLYANIDMAVMKKLTSSAIQKGEAVWFGCDVGKYHYRDDGIMDTELFDLKNLLEVDFGFTKAERLRMGESLMTHAMVFTAVDLLDDKIQKWRVENSWGAKKGKSGYYSMSDEWFEEYVYQVVLPKSTLPVEIQKIFEQKPHHLPPWDPFGSLAQ